MAFTLSGSIITQSGTDTPSTVISGLSAISGVTSTNFNTYTRLSIPYKLIVNGSITINRTVKLSFTRGGTFANEITVNSTGSLICKDVRNENGYNYYYELPSMDFNNTPIVGYNGGTLNAIIVNGGTLDLANITINADGGHWWNGGTIKFRNVTLNGQGIPSNGDTQFTSQSGNPNIDIIGFNVIGGRVFIGSGTIINFKEFKPQFMQRGFGSNINNFVVNDFIGGFGNIGDVSIWTNALYEYRNPNLGTSLTYEPWLSGNPAASGTIKITSDLTITLKDNLGSNVNSFIGYLKDNATGAPTGYTTQITYIQTAVNNVMSANVLIGVLVATNGIDTAFVKRSSSQTNDEYAFTLFSYGTTIITTSPLNLAGIWTKSYNVIATADTNITLTEANAITKLASNFTVNRATNTITVTANSTLDDLYDVMKVYKTRPIQAQLEYPTISTQPVTASGDTLVTAMNVVGLEFLTAGVKFKKLQTNGTANGTISNLTVNGNVSQATPTNLSNVTITGTLTYNTNTATSITITNTTIGTVANSGTGIVTIEWWTITTYTDAEINYLNSTATIHLPTWFDEFSIYASNSDALNEVNALFSGTAENNVIKYKAELYGWATIYIRPKDNDIVWEVLIMPQVVPVGIGNYDFTVVSFSESTQLNTVIAQLTNLTTITAKETTSQAIQTKVNTLNNTDLTWIALTSDVISAIIDIKGADSKDITQVYNNTPSIDPASVWQYADRTLTQVIWWGSWINVSAITSSVSSWIKKAKEEIIENLDKIKEWQNRWFTILDNKIDDVLAKEIEIEEPNLEPIINKVEKFEKSLQETKKKLDKVDKVFSWYVDENKKEKAEIIEIANLIDKIELENKKKLIEEEKEMQEKEKERLQKEKEEEDILSKAIDEAMEKLQEEEKQREIEELKKEIEEKQKELKSLTKE